MIYIIAGPSHTGKTNLAQKLMIKYQIPYISMDHVKMGIVRAGLVPNYVEEDEKIGCRNCGSKTRAARWTECDWPSLPHDEEEARVRKELDETMHYAKQLAEAININREELARMIQE